MERCLDELNSTLYDDGKIYMAQGTSSLLEQTYTSKLMERLKKQGWKVEQFKGVCNIKDDENRIIIQEIGIVNALYQLAKQMQ